MGGLNRRNRDQRTVTKALESPRRSFVPSALWEWESLEASSSHAPLNPTLPERALLVSQSELCSSLLVCRTTRSARGVVVETLSSKHFEIFALFPVRHLGLEALDLGVLDVDVIVDKARAERVAEERIVLQRVDGFPQCSGQSCGLRLIRRVGGPNDPATRLENRIGEPAANPYLYMASQILSGLDGVDRAIDPGPSADTPYETNAALLPKTLREAVTALSDDPFFRQAFGAEFVDYYVHIKNAEIERFQAEVSDWEHREYFEMF